MYINLPLSKRSLRFLRDRDLRRGAGRLYVVSTRRGGGYALVEDRPSAVQPMVRRPGDTYETQLIIARETTQRDKTSETSTATEVVGYVKSKVFNLTHYSGGVGRRLEKSRFQTARPGYFRFLAALPLGFLMSSSEPRILDGGVPHGAGFREAGVQACFARSLLGHGAGRAAAGQPAFADFHFSVPLLRL